MKKGFRCWIEKRKLEKEIRLLRQKQLSHVQKYMKRIYNPVYYATKPKHHRRMSASGMISLRKAVRSVYNPDVKKEHNEIIDIEEKEKAEA